MKNISGENNTKPDINVACTVCGSKESTLLFSKNDCHQVVELSIHRCNACKNIYLGRYNEEYVDDLYEYYQKYKGKSREELFSEQTKLSYRKVLNFISQHTSGRSILDVGCGKGDFVHTALSDGWNIQGIELARPAVEIAQSFGLPVNQLDFFSEVIKPASYDVVTMFEVLEHLPDPVSFLRRAQNVVRPGGLVYLTTPNFRCVDRWILGLNWPVIHNEHLTYFTPGSLQAAIRERTNLTLLRSETRNVSIQSIQRIKGFFTKENVLIGSGSMQSVQSNEPVDFRETIEGSRVLRALKSAFNGLLNITSTGNTIIFLLKRPIEKN